MYEYEAYCIKVVDGDTYDFRVDLGFGIWNTIRVRLAGYDTPELRSKSLAERDHARQAKAFCAQALLGNLGKNPPTVLLRTEKDRTGKYGRYIARVYFLDEDDDEACIVSDLGSLLAFEGLLKRDSYPSDAELILDRQEAHRAMAQKRAMEGVLTVDEKTPVD